MSLTRLLQSFRRTKRLDADVMETPLRRCLGRADLTLLGLGNMAGSGLYVLSGAVAKKKAGPGIVLSFVMAGLAATLSSLCYAEFGAQIPKAGSAYTYTYVSIGELWAFVVGWNLLLENWLSSAAVARAWSGNVDAIMGGVIKEAVNETVGFMHADYLSQYPDFLAMGACVLVTVIIALGAKTSLKVNAIFTIVNFLNVVVIVVAGFSVADTDNWSDFLPFGFQGVLAGAASCFYAYLGFESIATAGEEVQHPASAIPFATIVTMGVATLCYVTASAALTLAQNFARLDDTAPFPEAFAARGLHWPRVVVAVGSVAGISSSLLGSLFALPRSIYAISADGLLFECFSFVHPRLQTPVVAVATAGAIAGVIALLFDMVVLVELLSIGTLMAYTIVAGCVVVLRYQPLGKTPFKSSSASAAADAAASATAAVTAPGDAASSASASGDGGAPAGDAGQETMAQEAAAAESAGGVEGGDGKRRLIVNTEDFGKVKPLFKFLRFLSNQEPGAVVPVAVVVMVVAMFCAGALLNYGLTHLRSGLWWAVCLMTISVTLTVLSYLTIYVHVQNDCYGSFKVPFVPFLPCLSIFLNIVMMVQLSYSSWWRFLIWMTIGFVIYFSYGIRHSKENEDSGMYGHLIDKAQTKTETKEQPVKEQPK